ncbi:glutathione peroxidase [Jejuia spongiicola]|uniref:Glutathione peroxidase n=1 Tax=Jejuia spongiicola TaxID=2942207 RepID=A0ABT0QGK7_9FLAO|nr:glutathione peroxidase [Jejuia spongiicola]MCL6296107.1 glutathione peroxidase [Jejuia spongiicola]
MNPIKTFFATLSSKSSEKKMDIDTIYDIKIDNLNGIQMDLSEYKGKYILIVNVASKCGFTSQYKDLQSLHEQFENKIQVLGVPCNQFGGQEPGKAENIMSFCKINYGVTFPITRKVDVKGKHQHPLYTWLTNKINNNVKDSSVKWNFQKYLIDPDGNLVNYYLSSTNPLSSKIVKHLK